MGGGSTELANWNRTELGNIEVKCVNAFKGGDRGPCQKKVSFGIRVCLK